MKKLLPLLILTLFFVDCAQRIRTLTYPDLYNTAEDIENELSEIGSCTANM